IIPGLTSVFFWEGKAEKDPEVLLLIKTTGRAYAAMEESIQQMHPYELPEIIAVRIDRGLGEYLSWISSETE
ncbi:divalent-cation tolerance protein CutA, partial [Enterococcus hirae]